MIEGNNGPKVLFTNLERGESRRESAVDQVLVQANLSRQVARSWQTR